MVQVEPLALAHDVTGPVDPDRGEVRELRSLVLRCGLDLVEVLHPDDEVESGRARRRATRAAPCGGCRRGACPSEMARSGRSCEHSPHVLDAAPTTETRRWPPQGGAHDVTDGLGSGWIGGPMELILARDGATCVWCGRDGRRRARRGDHRTRRTTDQGRAELDRERGRCMPAVQRTPRAPHAERMGRRVRRVGVDTRPGASRAGVHSLQARILSGAASGAPDRTSPRSSGDSIARVRPCSTAPRSATQRFVSYDRADALPCLQRRGGRRSAVLPRVR